jgi:hypothetical protein
MLGRTTGNSNSQESPRPEFRGSHHLPPYSILCTSPRGPYPNGFLFRNSQVGTPKLPKLRLPRLWGAITLCVDLWLRSNQSCNPCQEFFNNMSHTTWRQGNQVDSWLLVVGSQIGNLTLDLSFGHNLCFKCLNGSCEPIFDIYVLITFQWYEEFLEPLGFDPCNHFLNIRKSTRTPTPHMGVHLKVWGFFPSHSFALPRAWECHSRT